MFNEWCIRCGNVVCLLDLKYISELTGEWRIENLSDTEEIKMVSNETMILWFPLRNCSLSKAYRAYFLMDGSNI